MDSQMVFNGLIHAGWEVIETDFDEKAFEQWRRYAHRYISLILGEDHAYAIYFARLVDPNRMGLLTGVGILEAVSAEIARTEAVNSKFPQLSNGESSILRSMEGTITHPNHAR